MQRLFQRFEVPVWEVNLIERGCMEAFDWSELETRDGGIPQSRIYCTLTALIRKGLIINGAGEGNRTLVIITKLFCSGSPRFVGNT
jgi:hypothetical protein